MLIHQPVASLREGNLKIKQLLGGKQTAESKSHRRERSADNLFLNSNLPARINSSRGKTSGLEKFKQSLEQKSRLAKEKQQISIQSHLLGSITEPTDITSKHLLKDKARFMNLKFEKNLNRLRDFQKSSNILDSKQHESERSREYSITNKLGKII
jgi:hypothetical protein